MQRGSEVSGASTGLGHRIRTTMTSRRYDDWRRFAHPFALGGFQRRIGESPLPLLPEVAIARIYRFTALRTGEPAHHPPGN